MIEALRTLADLLDGGRTPSEAFDLLARAGVSWAAEARAAVATGGDPAGALVRAGALDPDEVTDLGGAAAAIEPAALRLAARRRAAGHAARRGALRALILPGLGTLTTALTGLWIPRGAAERIVDILPLAVVALLVLGATRPWVSARLRGLAQRLPGGRRRAALHGLWAAAPLDGPGLARAARFVPAGPLARACARSARRIEQGDSLDGVLPTAAEVGAEAAGAIVAGVADPRALTAAADDTDRRAAARWIFAVRLAGWAALFFVSVRLIGALLTADIGSVEGLEGLEGLLPGGVDPKAMEELMRELDLP